MLEQLNTQRKVVGIKQLRRSLQEGRIARVFAAEDADPRLTEPLEDQCRQSGVELIWVPTMAQLGKACGISVGASAAGILAAAE
ncbi:MAG: ribosomal L7Ae/L30e/S12e/Gadd45 family protein [Oscillospiraceae bacterium]|nr:ribosomal L7Ae/L30e/S12e/Gadd45 family protein [Oscillospiraceae bacterium]